MQRAKPPLSSQSYPNGKGTPFAVTEATHLNFRGDARATLAFYHAVFGGELTIFTHGDMGNVQVLAGADQIMWGQVDAPNGFRIMAYDVPASRPWSRGEDPFFVSLRGESADEIAALWDALAEKSTIIVPIAPAPWAPPYGMLKDPFGVTWVVDVVAQYDAA